MRKSERIQELECDLAAEKNYREELAQELNCLKKENEQLKIALEQIALISGAAFNGAATFVRHETPNGGIHFSSTSKEAVNATRKQPWWACWAQPG